MNEPDAGRFLPLHPLELRVLLAVEARPCHGYRIVKEIERREGGRLTIYPANLYRRIRDMLDRGLLEETDPPAGEEDADPRRTYFRPTRLGRKVALAETARLEELAADARRALGRA